MYEGLLLYMADILLSVSFYDWGRYYSTKVIQYQASDKVYPEKITHYGLDVILPQSNLAKDSFLNSMSAWISFCLMEQTINLIFDTFLIPSKIPTR